MLGASLPLAAIATLCVLKFASWSIALGSGTSGGTLAPLFTIGGACGALLGAAVQHVFPHTGIEVGMAALVGMAAIFAGAAHALLAAAVFAFETTLQPLGLPPLLGGCAASFLVSSLLMRHSIMTEKIARRGVHVPRDYDADALAGIPVARVMTGDVITLRATQSIADARAQLGASPHARFPIVDDAGRFAGYAERRRLLDPATDASASIGTLATDAAHVTRADATVRDAIDQLALHDVGAIAVLDAATGGVVGIVTRGDVLRAHGRLLRGRAATSRHLRFGRSTPAAT